MEENRLEVVPVFLEVLDTHTARLPTDEYYLFMQRVRDRLDFGMRKYGVPLTINDGRNSIREAWEEACDGCQYLTQAYCEGKLPDPQLIHDQIDILLRLEKILNDQ